MAKSLPKSCPALVYTPARVEEVSFLIAAAPGTFLDSSLGLGVGGVKRNECSWVVWGFFSFILLFNNVTCRMLQYNEHCAYWILTILASVLSDLLLISHLLFWNCKDFSSYLKLLFSIMWLMMSEVKREPYSLTCLCSNGTLRALQK